MRRGAPRARCSPAGPQALDRLVAARSRGGRAARALLRDQLAELAALVAAAAGCAAAQPAAIRARLETLLASLADLAPAMPEERVAQEVALLVARADVREELDRLRAHLAQAGDLLRAGRGGRPPARFPVPGVQPRGQHAVLEIGRYRADPHRARAEGGDRAVPRAGAEPRMSAPTRQRQSAPRLSAGAVLALGRRQDDDHAPAGRARSEPRPVGLGDDAAAAAGRDRRQGLPFHRPAAASTRWSRRASSSNTPRVFGNCYGTPRRPIEAALAAGRDIVSDHRLAGHAAARREACRDDLVTVFVLAAEHGRARGAAAARAPRTAPRSSPPAWRNRPRR